MEWKEVRLGDVIDYKKGFAFKSSMYKSTGTYIIRVSDTTSNSVDVSSCNCISPELAQQYTDYSLKTKDIIIATVGSWPTNPSSIVGKVVRVPESANNALLNQNAVRIRSNGLFDSEYLYYLLKEENFSKYLVGTAQGSANQASITLKDIFEYTFSAPSEIEDQRRIASVLSSLDRKIELNNKINADLEEMAQTIFKNWLSECSDDVTIGELSLNITNYEKADAEEVVLINSSDVTEGYFDHHNYSPNKNLKGHFKKRFQKGDILYSQVRPKNRHWAYCNFDANDYLASTQLMVIRNNPSLITSILLYQYIISDNVWKEFTLKTETRSGTFPQGNYEDLSQILVPYDSDVEGISNQLETLYAKMFMLKKENSRLSALRDTLLPKLMSGELEVSE